MAEVTLKQHAVCNTCTIRLVRTAYQRAPWFRLVREPLRLALRGLAWLHRIDPAAYAVRTACASAACVSTQCGPPAVRVA